MKEPDLRIGDVVQMRSGGPIMTVIGFRSRQSAEFEANLVWFDERENKFVYQELPCGALEKAPSKAPRTPVRQGAGES